jgi:hypothetical protein
MLSVHFQKGKRSDTIPHLPSVAKVAMNCGILQDADGEHLGAMLSHMVPGATTGTCVFSVVPVRPDLFDSPAAEALFRRGFREVGECELQLIRSAPPSAVVRSPGLPDLFVEFDDSGDGQWGEFVGGRRQVAGRAVLAGPA